MSTGNTMSKLRELAALAVAGETPALRRIHADHLRRTVAAAIRAGVGNDEIERLITAAQWAARARTCRNARKAAIVQAGRS